MHIHSRLAAAAFCLFAVASHAGDLDLSYDRGLRLRFPSEQVEIHLGGRIHLDYAFFDDDLTPIEDDFDLRRARPELEARFGDDWKLKVEYDFAFDEGWRSAWVTWDGLPKLKLRLGNQMSPFGLEEMQSSNDIVFAERSVASALTPLYGTGLVASSDGRAFGRTRYTLAGGVYVEPFADRDYDRHQSEHLAFATRGTFAPLARKKRVLQLGVSYEYRDLSGDHTWSVARRLESSLVPPLIGAELDDVATTNTVGAEAALMLGPVLLQGEYLHTSVARSGLSDPGFDGYYAQASWVVTGERHRYSRSLATFGGVRPRRAFGAFEIGVRYSALDLTDSGVLGGEAKNIAFVTSWWIRENVRFLFNYVRVDAKLSDTLESDEPQIFQLRFIYHL
jgi:phosphate-selective porin OprO/OprP